MTFFRTHIREANQVTTTESANEIDNAIEHITTTIIIATMPSTTHRDRCTRTAPDTLNAIRYRNGLNRQWQRYHDVAHKATQPAQLTV